MTLRGQRFLRWRCLSPSEVTISCQVPGDFRLLALGTPRLGFPGFPPLLKVSKGLNAHVLWISDGLMAMALQLEVTEPSPPLSKPRDHSRAVRGCPEHPPNPGFW